VQASALAGVVLNDIGPELDPRGLARIAGYAGDDPGPMSEEEAVARNRMLFSAALPNLTDEEWLAETRRGYRRYDDGSYGLDYDPAIGQVGGGEVPDLWPYFRALRRIPTLAIRGALSDILSERTFERMAEEKPDLVRATVPNRGHVPMLDEPECLAALDAFLESFSHERH
jgi:pimeloyl-ACP methyl ester carboxylesterase